MGSREKAKRNEQLAAVVTELLQIVRQAYERTGDLSLIPLIDHAETALFDESDNKSGEMEGRLAGPF